MDSRSQKTTAGSFPRVSATVFTSTVAAMFVPQWHTKTPILCIVYASLFAVFPECADDCLLRQIVIQHFGNLLRFQVILSLLTDYRQSDCFHQFCRFHVSADSVLRRQSRTGIYKWTSTAISVSMSPCFHHIYKLMRMIFHCIIRRTGTAEHFPQRIHFSGLTPLVRQRPVLSNLPFSFLLTFTTECFCEQLGEIYNRQHQNRRSSS